MNHRGLPHPKDGGMRVLRTILLDEELNVRVFVFHVAMIPTY